MQGHELPGFPANRCSTGMAQTLRHSNKKAFIRKKCQVFSALFDQSSITLLPGSKSGAPTSIRLRRRSPCLVIKLTGHWPEIKGIHKYSNIIFKHLTTEAPNQEGNGLMTQILKAIKTLLEYRLLDIPKRRAANSIASLKDFAQSTSGCDPLRASTGLQKRHVRNTVWVTFLRSNIAMSVACLLHFHPIFSIILQQFFILFDWVCKSRATLRYLILLAILELVKRCCFALPAWSSTTMHPPTKSQPFGSRYPMSSADFNPN